MGAGAAQERLLSAGCGTALVALSFVPLWASYRIPGLGLFPPETRHLNAWAAYGLGMQVALVLTVVVVALTVVPQARRSPAAGGGVPLALAVAATLSLLWEAIGGPEGSSRPGGYGIARGVLLFAGMGLACGMTYGCYLALRGTRTNGPTGRADRGE